MPVPTAHVVVAFNASIKTVLVEEKKDSSKLVEDLCPSAFFSAICFFFLPKALSHAMWQHFVVFMSGFRFFFFFLFLFLTQVTPCDSSEGSLVSQSTTFGHVMDLPRPFRGTALAR